jgi:hypothetical protein
LRPSSAVFTKLKAFWGCLWLRRVSIWFWCKKRISSYHLLLLLWGMGPKIGAFSAGLSKRKRMWTEFPYEEISSHSSETLSLSAMTITAIHLS